MARAEPDQSMPGGLLGVLLVIRFVAELGLLAGFVWIGFRVDGPIALSVVLAVLLPVLAAVAWGLWVAPKSQRRLVDPSRFAVEVTLFGAALIGLLQVGPAPQAGGYGVALWLAWLGSAFAGRKRY
ncbi:MAG TPA: YrdB family protein [Nocardioidaceae bacterium]|nr:YrdB family protein [Nocardioidaceae bacterium]